MKYRFQRHGKHGIVIKTYTNNVRLQFERFENYSPSAAGKWIFLHDQPHRWRFMRQIDDFELIGYYDNIRLHEFDRARPPTIPPVPPCHPRLRVVVDRGFPSKLYFRGAVVEHLQIDESELVAQFEAENGYVLFVAELDNQSPKFSTLAIYYVLKDFSGAEYGTLSAWDDFYSPWERLKIMIGTQWGWGEFGPDPLKQIYPVNNKQLNFEVSGMGWYNLMLHESPPRRFLVSSSTFSYMNSKIWHSRYFCIWRISRDA